MKKTILAAVLTAISFVFLGLGFTTSTKASAATSLSYDTFTMENGAAARIKSLTDEEGNVVESNGMRFSAEISQTEYENLKAAGARFGVVIVAKDLLKDTVIDANTVFGTNSAFYFTNEEGGDKSKIAMLHIANPSCQDIDEDPQVEICGSIVNIQVNNFTRSFVGRAYVAIPQVNAETGETEYQYSFAPYYEENIENNTRCIYYIAQRAVEEKKAEAETLNEKYIEPFAATGRYQNYTYRYAVEHYFIVHHAGEGGEIHPGETSEHEVLHVEKQYFYATLNSYVTAEPIEKPEGVEKIENLDFIYDRYSEEAKATGLVYAAGMQTLRLYYEPAEMVSEEHRLAALVADFLNKDKAETNFGLHINLGNGGSTEDWVASEVWDPNFVDDPNDPDDKAKQIGIALYTDAGNQNRHLLLSKDFFEQLREFGVESISFDFHSAPGSKKEASYRVFQEEDTSAEMPVYDAETGEELTGKIIDSTEHERIKIYLEDITVEGGVLIEVTTNSTSNLGQYHFGNIQFTFLAINQEE